MTQTNTGDILTINPNGVFVGGVQTTKYNGATIRSSDKYAAILGNDFAEVQVMQSETEGDYLQPGEPTPSNMGLFMWMRALDKEGTWSDWLRNVESTGFPPHNVAIFPFQSTEKEVRLRLQENVLVDCLKLQSAQRPYIRQVVLNNIKKNKPAPEATAQTQKEQKEEDPAVKQTVNRILEQAQHMVRKLTGHNK